MGRCRRGRCRARRRGSPRARAARRPRGPAVRPGASRSRVGAVAAVVLQPGTGLRELLGGSAQYGAGASRTEQPTRVVQGVQAGRAAARNGRVGALELVPDGALARGAVHHGVGEARRVDEEGLLAGERVAGEVHHRLGASGGGAEGERGALAGAHGPVALGVVEKCTDGGHREPGDPVHGAGSLLAEHLAHAEGGHDAADAVGGGSVLGTEAGDGAAPLAQARGVRVPADAVRRHGRPSSDHRVPGVRGGNGHDRHVFLPFGAFVAFVVFGDSGVRWSGDP